MKSKQIYLTGDERRLLQVEMRTEKKVCMLWSRPWFPKEKGTPLERIPKEVRSDHKQRLALVKSILAKLR